VFEIPSGPGVRVDTFGYSGYSPNPRFDSLLAKLVVVELQHRMSPAAVARGAVDHLGRALQARGGVILIGRDGAPEAAFNTPAMPFAIAT